MDLKLFSFKNQPPASLSTEIRLLLPVFLVFTFFFGCFLIIPQTKTLILGGLMIAYFIPPSGKESLIPVGIALGIPWWLMAFTLAFLDVVTALFMILNFDLVLRLPYIGPWATKFLNSGTAFMAERPWLSRWRILGVAFFVFLPLQGTGGVGATIVGMMTGLNPGEILLAIGIGASVECLVFAIGSELILNLILTNFILGVTVALLVILTAAAGMFMYIRYRNRKRQA
ncbi:MAG: small multi-drug export protein [Methanoregulaceae archaeon]|nr:small multi-drug export protein [Methanoregulaceae archaeon]